MSIDIIVNPVHPEGLHASARVQALCVAWGEEFRVRTTSIARPHGDPDPRADLTVVIGGDGTVRAVAGALQPDPGWAGTVAVVPTGTASLFSLNCGIRSLGEGLRLLEQGRDVTVTRCDIGWVSLKRGREEPAELPFLVSAGIGHSGSTLHRTPQWAKTWGGAAGYAVGALTRLRAPLVPVRLDLGEEGELASLPVWAVEFGNIARIPYGVTVFPHGGIRTGSLAALAVIGREVAGREVAGRDAADRDAGGREVAGREVAGRDAADRDAGGREVAGREVAGREVGDGRATGARQSVGPWAWGRIFCAGFCGGHDRVEDLLLRTVAHGRVESDVPLPAHVDGEPVGRVTALRARIAPAALPVLTAEGAPHSP